MSHEPQPDVATSSRIRELVSHDLKNPISAAWTTAAFMTEMADDSDDLTRRNLGTIGSALTRALDWIEDFDVTMHLEAGSLKPSHTDTDAAAFITRFLEHLPEDTVRRTVHEGWEGPLPADPELLGRSLRALVTYAMERGPTDATVSLEMTGDRDMIRITCADRGRSVPQVWGSQGIPSLEDPVPEGTPRPPLSLLLCQAVAKGHGGSFEAVHDNGENRLTLVLPRRT